MGCSSRAEAYITKSQDGRIRRSVLKVNQTAHPQTPLVIPGIHLASLSFKTYQLVRQRLTATYRPHYRLTNDYYRREIAHQTNSLADLHARFP